MQNLNSYNEKTFQIEFEKTDTFLLLKQKYNRIFFKKFFENEIISTYTPRHIHSLGESRISAVPWYYLNYLDTSGLIVDIGCGVNFFKPFFKNLHGIGAEDPLNTTGRHSFYGDEHGVVDDKFYQNHYGLFHSMFSINALHFQPLENLRNLCLNFCSMLKVGGRGFLTLNSARLVEHSVYLKHLDGQLLDQWIRNQFDDFPHKILVFDVDLFRKDAWMDGNIRIVFEN